MLLSCRNADINRKSLAPTSALPSPIQSQSQLSPSKCQSYSFQTTSLILKNVEAGRNALHRSALKEEKLVMDSSQFKFMFIAKAITLKMCKCSVKEGPAPDITPGQRQNQQEKKYILCPTLSLSLFIWI